ncbi:hypothetical protein [Curtobacterium sp. MCBA15_001]|uniref:hypothetical protein n=1 Tax=Curtobacterium sp. MCBA15_001 TaxID=1898731 RepID=UPI0008DE5E69|nr:hypothetical protein [Curtobacterium sp. MCBA15_001]OIH97930.1 hypothetical protein BIU90_12995 [Curtobacterium sp. MCBA15_001]
MPHPRPLPLDISDGPFRVADALRAGVTAGRLRRQDVHVIVHGVRSTERASAVRGLALVMRSDQFFSHTTAVALWGLPLPRRVRDRSDVHVTTAGSGPLMRRPDVVGHRALVEDENEVTVVAGLRVSSQARAWSESAALLDFRALVVLGDAIVGASDRRTISDLAAQIRPGGRHVRLARAALEHVRVGSESPMETGLRLDVVDAGFPEPELNVDVHDEDGRFLGRVDMAWPEYRIALEYDGDHHRERDAFRHDQRRGNGFAVSDWLVIHATAADAVRTAVLLERLRQAFARRRGFLA